MTACPTCGQEWPVPFEYDTGRRKITRDGKTARLGYAGNLIFALLLKNHPETTYAEVIEGVVWGGRDVDARNNLGGQIYRLRKKLKPLHIEICSVLGRAAPGIYWLEW